MKKNEYINEYCTGCGLCHSIKNKSLEKNDKGFPSVCVNEKEEISFYEKVCPVFSYKRDRNHDVWGNYQRALIGYSSNPEVRLKASSGGALTEICSYLVEKKIVDGIIHVTFDSENPTKTVTVVSKSRDEIISRCGSRYSISVPLYDIINIIDKDKKYAFVGKPCDVMALRNYFKINKELEESFLYLLSFFCAGEPSETAQENLLRRLGSTTNDCKSLTYRGNGWPGYTTAVTKSGEVLTMEYKEAWGQYLGRDLRNICRFCMDGTGDAADIVCADFWQLDQNKNPDFSEHEGRNIIITRNGKSTELLEQIINDGKIYLESDFTNKMENEFHFYQPAQYKRKGTMSSMISAMKLCGRKAPDYDKNLLKTYSSHFNSKIKMKYFLGIIKRVILGRL